MAVIEKDIAEPRRVLERHRGNTGEKKIHYPERDGKPMAETIQHRNVMIYAIQAAQMLLADRADAYVSGNEFLYYVEGDPRKCVSPDCYVVFGVEPKPTSERNSYFVWKENNQLPVLVLETTSKSTRREDVTRKGPLYEAMGVLEYIRFDPTGDYLHPRLQGSRLVGNRYEPMEMIDGRLTSEVLNAYVLAEGENLRFIDRRTGKPVLSAQEQTALLREETQRANEEAQRANEEAQRASAEAQRADSAEQEIARLRAELAAMRPQRQVETDE